MSSRLLTKKVAPQKSSRTERDIYISSKSTLQAIIKRAKKINTDRKGITIHACGIKISTAVQVASMLKDIFDIKDISTDTVQVKDVISDVFDLQGLESERLRLTSAIHIMLSSGVQVNDQCVSVYQELKLRKKYQFVIFKLSTDNTTVEVDHLAEKGSYDDFISHLPANECRYAVYDFEFEKSTAEGVRNKIVFYYWAPETSKVKQKMLYSASKDALRKKLDGVSAEVQATDLSEVAYDEVLERLHK